MRGRQINLPGAGMTGCQACAVRYGALPIAPRMFPSLSLILRSSSFFGKAPMNVLVLNAGSSSLKFQIISTDLEQIKAHKDNRILRGEIDGIGGVAVLKIRYRTDAGITLTAPLRDMGAALDYLLRYIVSD